MTQIACKSLIVQKFGGTSVGTIERIQAVAERVIEAKEEGKQLVVVVSAMSGETNRLLGLAQQIDAVPAERELDVLMSAGEQVSMALLAMMLNKMGHAAVSLTGWQAGIKTDSQYNDANIIHVDPSHIQQLLERDQIVIVAGFQGITDEGDITTLGRGGSDTTAVALAGALNADECQIFTDVDGVYTCDPRLVPQARRLDVVHFDDMTSMARNGAKVLQLQSVEYARQHGVPLRVLSSFEEGEGTLVSFESSAASDVVGIALKNQQTLLDVDMPVSELQEQLNLFGMQCWCKAVAADLTQIVTANEDLARLKLVLDKKMHQVAAVSTLSVVGNNVQNKVDHVCAVLAEAGVLVRQKKRSAHCLSLLINEDDHQLAVDVVHKRFVVEPESLDNRPLLAVS
ncbi:aspartate kinase [Photobacterium lipolyticum]|uniref:Aspartokinase n=1 Tax=Photobacterium lipolyticum TaxID=266810 RepID=A0A2T3MXP5_9GAMM|nr:aspartate kinase [Photobacterium lipolyticum]PSW04725.1 aspartate kinase [Photobacterium lipolyticum]